MSIIRAPRPLSNFYLLDKQISEDERLSWAARGLLIFLLGKPDHWRVSVQNLINETAKSGMPSKRDAVYRILGELQQVGYITRSQSKAASGTFDKVDYMVSEIPSAPLPENPHAEGAPLPAQPDTDEPHTVKPTLVSTEKAASTENAESTDKKLFPQAPAEKSKPVSESDGQGSLLPADDVPADEATSTAGNETFEYAWSIYPKRSGGNSRVDALKQWNARIKQGKRPKDMIAGLKRYTAYQEANGKIGTQYVKTAAVFFGVGLHFEDEWTLPAATPMPTRRQRTEKFDSIAFVNRNRLEDSHAGDYIDV